jgi:gamma-glutamyltranspeptidase / glutathione hydrolase
MPLADILAPAIELAEQGFPVSPVTAHHWKMLLPQLQRGSPHGAELMVEGSRAPRCGEVFRNPGLAGILRRIGKLCCSFFPTTYQCFLVLVV